MWQRADDMRERQEKAGLVKPRSIYDDSHLNSAFFPPQITEQWTIGSIGPDAERGATFLRNRGIRYATKTDAEGKFEFSVGPESIKFRSCWKSHLRSSRFTRKKEVNLDLHKPDPMEQFQKGKSSVPASRDNP